MTPDPDTLWTCDRLLMEARSTSGQRCRIFGAILDRKDLLLRDPLTLPFLDNHDMPVYAAYGDAVLCPDLSVSLVGTEGSQLVFCPELPALDMDDPAQLYLLVHHKLGEPPLRPQPRPRPALTLIAGGRA